MQSAKSDPRAPSLAATVGPAATRGDDGDAAMTEMTEMTAMTMAKTAMSAMTAWMSPTKAIGATTPCRPVGP